MSDPHFYVCFTRVIVACLIFNPSLQLPFIYKSIHISINPSIEVGFLKTSNWYTIRMVQPSRWYTLQSQFGLQSRYLVFLPWLSSKWSDFFVFLCIRVCWMVKPSNTCIKLSKSRVHQYEKVVFEDCCKNMRIVLWFLT